VGLFVINGTGSNMNLREAAFLAAELDVGVAIPMHYGMWQREKYGLEATLDPDEFVRRFQNADRPPGSCAGARGGLEAALDRRAADQRSHRSRGQSCKRLQAALELVKLSLARANSVKGGQRLPWEE
jgi:hypothetical protein